VAKKSARTRSERSGDQYLIRMPRGLRDRIAQRASKNGRSVSAEIVEAIEKHLESADRITEIWEALKKHQQDIEDIGLIRQAVLNLEGAMEDVAKDTDFYGVLGRALAHRRETERLAKLPPITAEQAAHIRELIKQTAAPEDMLLKLLKVSCVEEIKEYDRAVWLLKARARHPKDPSA
jgi:predicted DNA-binding protein